MRMEVRFKKICGDEEGFSAAQQWDFSASEQRSSESPELGNKRIRSTIISSLVSILVVLYLRNFGLEECCQDTHGRIDRNLIKRRGKSHDSAFDGS